MNSAPSTQPSINTKQQDAVVLKQPQSGKIKPPEKKPLTFGQKVADKMATKVGSWAFLIGQSTILTGWVGLNLMPGVPHWDESPFILLNLVFSFASAYTAPVVLMSQNRQSEEDRESANHNYQVTLQAAQNLELLHEKLDAQYAKKIDELTVFIKQQHQSASEVKVMFVPSQNLNEFEHYPHKIATMSVLNPHSKKQAS
ncbi:MAG TPA: DUF1003 domain-containing protein [Stenomitos sp.]